MSFGGTRTHHRMACAIEDAGWVIKDCIIWLYGSGFPKATDISLIFDKDAYLKELTKELGRKPTKEEFKKGWEGFRKIIGRNPNSRENCDKSNTLYESGTVGKTDYITTPATPEAKLWNGWKSHGLKPAYEPILVAVKPNEGSYAENALRWKVAGLNIDGGRIETNRIIEPREYDKEMGSGMNCGNSNFGNNLKKNTDFMTLGRFPANVILECICDEVREGGEDKTISHSAGASGQGRYNWNLKKKETPKDYEEKNFGKIQIHTNPECPCYMLDKQSGVRNGFSGGGGPTRFAGAKGGEKLDNYNYYNDIGGASRFFYCAKFSRSERNMGCEGLEPKQVNDGRKDQTSILHTNPECPCYMLDKQSLSLGIHSAGSFKISSGTYKNNYMGRGKFSGMRFGDTGGASRFFYCAKASRSERNMGCEGFSNNHPTVKSLSLMEYLCTLTKTPTGGIVLDPFAGSGTTLIAAKKTGRDFIGIEKEPEYVKIAEARIKAIPNTLF
jgi:hypothetical protein